MLMEQAALRRIESNLPTTIEDLNDFILVGKEKIKAHQALVRAKAKTPETAGAAYKTALQDAQDVASAVIYAEVNLGKLLAPIPRKYVGSPKKTDKAQLPSLPTGISKRTSHQAQTLAKNPEKVEQAIAKAIADEKIPTPDMVYKVIKGSHVAHNSGENEWYTPPDYIEAAKKVMGAIDLDPASSDRANLIVQATIYYTAENDGLTKPWAGKVWMNPPYAAELITKFISKFISHVTSGQITDGIVLVNNATETVWFRELATSAEAIVFPSGRVRFLDPEGNPGAPLQGQAVVYFGDDPELFLREFSRFGWGVLLWKTVNEGK